MKKFEVGDTVVHTGDAYNSDYFSGERTIKNIEGVHKELCSFFEDNPAFPKNSSQQLVYFEDLTIAPEKEELIEKKPFLVYVAGPYSSTKGGEEFERDLNVAAAKQAGMHIAAAGAFPVLPTVQTQGFDFIQDIEFWLQGTAELLSRCDALFLAPGWESSTRCIQELELALEEGKPVFISIDQLSRVIKDPSKIEELENPIYKALWKSHLQGVKGE